MSIGREAEASAPNVPSHHVPAETARVSLIGDQGTVADHAGTLQPDTRPDTRLESASRLSALRLVGAAPTADATFDAFARLVRRLLDVPMALVSLVDDHRQCLMGATGLPSPLEQERQTPLSHSFCQHVVLSGEPLVVTDARTHPVLRGNGAVHDLGVIAYAGMPLTSDDGEILGSLAAIDQRSRPWTASELSILRELATACSTELQLRAEKVTLQQERDVSEALRNELAVRNAHLTVLTRLATAVAGTLDVATVAQTVADHLAEALSGWAAVVVTDAGTARTAVAAGNGVLGVELLEAASALGRHCSARPAVLDTSHDTATEHLLRALGVGRVLVAPITGRMTSGQLVLAVADHLTELGALCDLVTDIGTTAALALDNATLLARHRRIAETLQRQLLSDMPQFDGAVLAASYQAASDDAAIGGDWYDAFRHPDGSYWLVIGDVMGHDLHAAGTMARLQHFVRAIALDGTRAPHEVLERIDALLEHHGAEVYATCVAMRLRPEPRTARDRPARWTADWSNAGHLEPLRADADGVSAFAASTDRLLGVGCPRRYTHTASLPAGTDVVMFTDGLVERRRRTVDDGVNELRSALARATGATPLDICASVVKAMIDHQREDDVAIIVMQLHEPPDPGAQG